MSAAAPTICHSNPRQDEPGRVAGRSPRQLIWARFREDRAALIGLAVLVLLVLLALIAVFAGVISKHLAGHAPDELFQQTMTDEFELPLGPNWEFFFGGDSVGRDLFVRVIYGARTSLLIAGVATGVSVVIGTLLGLLAGYCGGWLDSVVSRITDVMLAIPYLLFALGVAAACNKTEEGCLSGLVGPGIPFVIFVIVIFTWAPVARIVRAQTLSLREREFVSAARVLGANDFRIMLRESLPNLIAPVIVFDANNHSAWDRYGDPGRRSSHHRKCLHYPGTWAYRSHGR
jgi:peptide/nickel transport system permease protein